MRRKSTDIQCSADLHKKEYRDLLKSVNDGKMVRIKAGVYIQPEALGNAMIDIEKVIPNGILCLYTAWQHYQLSTQVPDAIYIAIERTRKVTLPTFPDIELVFQKAELLNLGKTTASLQGHRLQITNLERSVCDAIKYRNKIGIDVMSEIVNNYLRRSDKNIGKLMEYATKLRVANTLKLYLQVNL